MFGARLLLRSVIILALFLSTPAPAMWWPIRGCPENLNSLLSSAGTPTSIPDTELGIINLANVPAAEQKRVRQEIIALARKIYDEGHSTKGKDTLFPIVPELFDGIERVDQKTQFSQVIVDKNGTVAGFVLAYYNPDSRTLHLEKIGVDTSMRRQGLMKTMLNASATRAAALGIQDCDLLVVKANTEAIEAYEKLGFKNVTPLSARNDPRFNAFQFAVSLPTLIQTTAKP